MPAPTRVRPHLTGPSEPVTDTMAEHLGARLAAELDGTCVQLLDRRQFRWSEHLLYRLGDEDDPGAERILVKRVKSQDRRGRTQWPAVDARVRTISEHAALDTIHRIFSRSAIRGLGAIRPRACFPDLDAIAMEYRPGRDLLGLIRRAVRPSPSRDAVPAAAYSAFRAGQWLALVHRALAAEETPVELDGQAYVQAMSAELEALAAAWLPHAGLPWDEAWEVIRRGVGPGTAVRAIPLHGDFYPDNIVIAEDGALYAVDTTLRLRGPVEDDLARFVVGVDTLKLRVLAGRALVRTEPIERVKRAFLEGYRARQPISRPLLDAGIVRAYLIRWSELRAVAGLDHSAPLVTVLRRRIDQFMASRLDQFLRDTRRRP